MYCEVCGDGMEKIETFHKCKDEKCGHERYENAIPVAVPLVKVLKRNGDIVLLGIIRGIQPQKGKIAFPGGFQEVESVENALHREFLEETGIDLYEKFSTKDIWEEKCIIKSTPDGRRNLMFYRCKYGLYETDINFDFRNHENEGMVLIEPGTELAFPLHQDHIEWGLL